MRLQHMRAPVDRVADPIVQGRLDGAGHRPGEIAAADQLRDRHEMITQALGLAYQVYRGLQRGGPGAAAIVDDDDHPGAVALQAWYLMRGYLVVPASIREVYVGESGLLSHERGEQVLLDRLLAAAERGRVEKVALVLRGGRYDLGIGDNFLPGLASGLVGELRIVQGFVADGVPGSYLCIEYPRHRQDIGAGVKEGGVHVVGLQDTQKLRCPLAGRAVLVAQHDGVLRYGAVFLEGVTAVASGVLLKAGEGLHYLARERVHRVGRAAAGDDAHDALEHALPEHRDLERAARAELSVFFPALRHLGGDTAG